MALIRIICDGAYTCLEIDGKSFGMGIEGVNFEHRADDKPRLTMTLDAKVRSRMPDGYFDKVTEQMLAVAAKENPAP